jgi:uncharacterized membrane protein YkoI
VLKAALAGLALILSTAGAWADDDGDDRQRARDLRERGEILPLQTILEKAQAERPGRVLEVEFDEEDHQYIYEVQILSPDGVVWEIEINAATGEPLEVERKRNRR